MLIDDLELKLNGKLPITRNELFTLVSSHGRKLKFGKTKTLDGIEVDNSIPNQCYDLSNLDVSQITDLSNIFCGSYYNGDISKWDVSNCTTIEGIFCRSKFNGDLSKWNTSNVTNMKWAFGKAKFNNNSISNWNVSNVENMIGMFGKSNFNKSIKNWNFNKNVNLNGFLYASKRKINLDKYYDWDKLNLIDKDFILNGFKIVNDKIVVIDNHTLYHIIYDKKILLESIDIKASGLTDLSYIFYYIKKIYGNVSNWDVSNITKMKGLMSKSKINIDISNWDVSNVDDFTSCFSNSKFNGDLSKWNVSSCVDMSYMFYKSEFNNDSLKNWNVSNVIDMKSMFFYSNFNGDISKWNISNVLNLNWMFSTSKFNGDISRLRFNKDVVCKYIFESNKFFEKKYNDCERLPYYTEDFLEWFENNRLKIGNINVTEKEKLDIENYLN